MDTETPQPVNLVRCDPARGTHVWTYAFSQLPTPGAPCQCGAQRYQGEK